MTPLQTIAAGMLMDKDTVHSYLPVYDVIFEDMRTTAKHVLEIGIGSGHCLQMWQEYFSNAEIYGVDVNDPMPLGLEPRIEQLQLDATLDSTIKRLSRFKYSLILDDGSHELSHQRTTCAKYPELLSKDGILVIEDVADAEERIPLLVAALPEGFEHDVIDLRAVKGRFDDVLLRVWRKGRETPKRWEPEPTAVKAVDKVKRIPAKAKIGVVIGTFAGFEYVRLGLEALRRNQPDVLVLVQDDHSQQSYALEALCDEYDAEFYYGPGRERSAPCVGDMSCYSYGMEWASRNGCDLLVKFSRRWIPLIKWADDLRRLASITQAPTYSGGTAEFGFGFRTECFAMHVSAWMASEAHGRIKGVVDRNETVFVEAYVHDCARIVWRDTQSRERAALARFVPQADGFQYWPLLGIQRTDENPGVLWHDVSTHFAYHGAALAYGLDASLEGFKDPNSGESNMPEKYRGTSFAG